MKSTTIEPERQVLIDGKPILIDIHPKTGKISPWSRKKQETELLTASYRRIEKYDPSFHHRAAKISDCGNYLEFWRYQNGERNLGRANFCRDPLCPMCSWRRSLKIYGQASQVLAVAEKEKYRFLFVTLTIENCHGVNLIRDLKRLYSGSIALLRRKNYKTVVHGWLRALEITHNIKRLSKSFDTYHPHIHMIWVVKPSYYGKKYISQLELTEDWQKTMNLAYRPLVDIRAIKPNNKGAVKEVAKYAVKPGEILVQDWDLTDSAVWTLAQALRNRRMISWGGNLKQIKADLKLDDIENGDLVNVDGEKPLNEELNYIIERYFWDSALGFHTAIKPGKNWLNEKTELKKRYDKKIQFEKQK